MTAEFSCLSLLELEEFRQQLHQASAEAERHLAECRRCQALLTMLHETASATSADELSTAPPAATEARGAERPVPAQGRVRTGWLWRAAAGSDPDFAWVVALIGRSPDNPDGLLVAPVAPHPELATDKDVLLDRALLGYPAFLDMTNLGTILREQLLEPVGELERPVAEAMVAMYRHLLSGAPAPEDTRRGVPAIEEADPRLLEQAERAEALQALWRTTHELIRDADEGEADVYGDQRQRAEVSAAAAEQSSAAPERARMLVLSGVLGEQLEGPGAEWDRGSLLEESGAHGVRLDAFLADRLDLTDKRDVADLARVLNVLHIPWEQAEPAVRRSLERSSGGARQAEGPGLRMAARSRAGADAEQTAKDLFADQSRVDATQEARRREIETYLAELRRELEELA